MEQRNCWLGERMDVTLDWTRGNAHPFLKINILFTYKEGIKHQKRMYIIALWTKMNKISNQWTTGCIKKWEENKRRCMIWCNHKRKAESGNFGKSKRLGGIRGHGETKCKCTAKCNQDNSPKWFKGETQLCKKPLSALPDVVASDCILHRISLQTHVRHCNCL